MTESMNRTHLIYVQTRYPHWSQHSGYHQFIRHIDEYPVDHRLTTYHHPSHREFVYLWPKLVVPWLATSWTSYLDLWTECRLITKVASLLNNGATVILHFLDAERGACLFFHLFAKERHQGRLRFYLTFHQPPPILAEIIRQPKLLGNANGIFLVGSSQLPFFSSLPPKKIHCIPHGIDTDFFQPVNNPRPANTPPFRCITVGNWLRDIDLLKKIILAAGPDLHFDLVGLPGLTQHFASDTQVTVHPHCNDTALLALYQNADLGLMPLIDSTANNGLLEMMACGLPIITNSVGSVPDYLDDHSAILIANRSQRDFLAAVRQLAEDDRRRRVIGDKAREQAICFSWQKICHRILAAYGLPQSSTQRNDPS